ILQTVPALRRRLFAQVFVSLDQAAALLGTSRATLDEWVKSGVLPTSTSRHISSSSPYIAATELLKRRSSLLRPPTAVTAEVAGSSEPAPRVHYEPITRAFLAGLGEPARMPIIPDPFQQAAVTASMDADVVVVAPS